MDFGPKIHHYLIVKLCFAKLFIWRSSFCINVQLVTSIQHYFQKLIYSVTAFCKNKGDYDTVKKDFLKSREQYYAIVHIKKLISNSF